MNVMTFIRMTTVAMVIGLAVTIAGSPVLAQTRPRPQAQAPVQAAAPAPVQFGKYCTKYRRDEPPVILFGIDRTIRKMRPVDLVAIDNAALKQAHFVEAGDRLQIFTIYDHTTTRKVIFDDCRPGMPSCLRCERSQISNTERDHDDREFLASIQQILASLKAEGSATTSTMSPYATQSAIASTINASVKAASGKAKALVLMTDLIDSEVWSMSPPAVIDDNSRMVKIKTAIDQKIIPSLVDADVWVYGFGLSDKDPYPQIAPDTVASIVKLWSEYFRKAKAKSINLMP